METKLPPLSLVGTPISKYIIDMSPRGEYFEPNYYVILVHEVTNFRLEYETTSAVNTQYDALWLRWKDEENKCIFGICRQYNVYQFADLPQSVKDYIYAHRAKCREELDKQRSQCVDQKLIEAGLKRRSRISGVVHYPQEVCFLNLSTGVRTPINIGFGSGECDQCMVLGCGKVLFVCRGLHQCYTYRNPSVVDSSTSYEVWDISTNVVENWFNIPEQSNPRIRGSNKVERDDVNIVDCEIRPHPNFGFLLTTTEGLVWVKNKNEAVMFIPYMKYGKEEDDEDLLSNFDVVGPYIMYNNYNVYDMDGKHICQLKALDTLESVKCNYMGNDQAIVYNQDMLRLYNCKTGDFTDVGILYHNRGVIRLINMPDNMLCDVSYHKIKIPHIKGMGHLAISHKSNDLLSESNKEEIVLSINYPIRNDPKLLSLHDINAKGGSYSDSRLVVQLDNKLRIFDTADKCELVRLESTSRFNIRSLCVIPIPDQMRRLISIIMMFVPSLPHVLAQLIIHY